MYPGNYVKLVQLRPKDAWKGLELNARDARLFLPPGLCTRCVVTEESTTHFVREATIAGADLREIIVLEPQHKVTFFQATGPREGAIINELFEDHAGALQLKFYCYVGLRDKEPGGSQEQAEQAQFDSEKGYKAALFSTLKRTFTPGKFAIDDRENWRWGELMVGDMAAAKNATGANEKRSVLCGWLPHCKWRFDVLTAGRVQSCVRPVDAAFLATAGPDGIREPGPTLLCRLR